MTERARKPISFRFVPLGFVHVCVRLLQRCLLSPVASIYRIQTYEFVWKCFRIIVIVNCESWDSKYHLRNTFRISMPNNEFHSMDWQQLMFDVGSNEQTIHTLEFALIGNFHGFCTFRIHIYSHQTAKIIYRMYVCVCVCTHVHNSSRADCDITRSIEFGRETKINSIFHSQFDTLFAVFICMNSRAQFNQKRAHTHTRA